MSWDCTVCGKNVLQSRAFNDDGKELFGPPDLSTPLNLFNPASLYWNVEHDVVFCGARHSLDYMERLRNK